MRSRRSAALLLLLPIAACSGGGRRVGVAGAFARYDRVGVASWYGEEASGNRTASGERFDPGALTVAHRDLPLGTLVEVTALDTGRTIVVRVNDRGPGRRDRLIDLSRGAAHLLGTDARPLARVRVRAVPYGSGIRPGLLAQGVAPGHGGPVVEGRYLLQVASFSDRTRAEALAERIGGGVSPSGSSWRVRLGPFDSAAQAQRARDAVAADGYADARLILIP